MVEKVGYTRPVNAARTTRKASAIAAPGFADALSAAEATGVVEAAEGVSAVQALSAMGGLVGIQEVDEREARRQKALKQGRLTLDALAQLRDALLMGSLPFSTITKLEQLVKQERTLTTDPLLSAILDEIEVRAAVELAKLEMSGITLPPTQG